MTKLPTYCIDVVQSKVELDRVIRWCEGAFDPPVNKRSIYKELLGKLSLNGFVMVAYDQKILGYIAFYCNDRRTATAYISLIAVIPEQQNRHIGRTLLRCGEDYCRGKDMHSIRLEVKLHNKNAIRFYQKSGFTLGDTNGNESIYMTKEIRKG